jgi:hypothetical protein
VQAFGDEALEPPLGLRDGVGARDAGGVETLRAGFAFKRGFQRVRVG